MPSDENDTIAVSIVAESEQQHFRLLELPPEILSLITSENAPILQLKSREVPTANPKDASLVLCTPEKTYTVRQVNTSNSVWVTQPRHSTTHNAGIEAIARIDSTLELLPLPDQSAAPFIKAALPMFVSTGQYTSHQSISKADLFSHIPLDQKRCEADFCALAAFESETARGCFVPSVKVKARVLEQIGAAATASGVDVTTVRLSRDIVPAFAADMVQEWPADLIVAVVRSVSVPESDLTLVVDETLFVLHSGLSLLQTRTESGRTDSKAFVRAWKDLMPEKWRASCQLSLLKGSYTTYEGGAMISYAEGNSPIFDTTATDPPADKAASLGAKRKWHEKFRPSKKTS